MPGGICMNKLWEVFRMKNVMLAFAAAAFALTTAISPLAVQAKEVRIVMGASGDGALERGMALFAKKIEEGTGGDYTGKVFLGTLLSYAETTEGLSNGTAEIGYMVPAYVRGEFPLTNYAIDIVATVVEPVVGGGAITEFIFNCEPCLAEFKRRNQAFTGFAVVGPYIFMSKEPVSDVSELKGMKIRGFSAFNKLVDQWDATAVSVNVGEVYQALQSGRIEGNIHLWDIISSYSLGDHVEYVYDAPIGIYGGNSMFNINLDFWKSLSDENKRIFLNSANDALAYATVKYVENNENLIADAEGLKVEEVETPDSMRVSIEKFRENNIKEVIAAAEQDDTIPDAKELGDRLLALIEKWRGLVKDIDETDVDAVAQLYQEQIYDKVDISTLE